MTVVHVRHSAPVVLVPARSRNERVVRAAVSTPVTLREVDPAAFAGPGIPFAPAGVPPDRGLAYHAFEGAYWHDLSGYADAPRIGPDILAAHLAGTLPDKHPYGTQLLRAFNQTPVPAEGGRANCRGEDFDLATARRIVDDRREEWEGHLRDHLARDLVVAGDRVFVRACGPLAFHMMAGSTAEFGIAVYPRLAARPHIQFARYCRPDRIDEYRRAMPPAPNHRWLTGVETLPDAFDPGLIGDDDVVLFLNAAPHVVSECLQAYDGGPESFGGRKLAELRPWVWRGGIGAIRMTEADHVIRLLREAIEGMRAIRPLSDPLRKIEAFGRFAEGIALPRLREARALAQDDADVFAALDMGGP